MNEKTDRELLEEMYTCLCGNKDLGIEGIVCRTSSTEKRIGRVESILACSAAVLAFIIGVLQYFNGFITNLFKGG